MFVDVCCAVSAAIYTASFGAAANADDAGDVFGHRGAGGVGGPLLDGRFDCILADEPRVLDVSPDLRTAERAACERAAVSSLVVLALLLVRVGRARGSVSERVDLAVPETRLVGGEDARSQRLAAIVGLDALYP